MAGSGDLLARVIRNGAVDTGAMKAIESESDPLQSAAANSIAANFEEKRRNYSAAAHYLQAALVFLPDHGCPAGKLFRLLLRLGRPEEALLRAQQATRASPQSADAFLVLGYASIRVTTTAKPLRRIEEIPATFVLTIARMHYWTVSSANPKT